MKIIYTLLIMLGATLAEARPCTNFNQIPHDSIPHWNHAYHQTLVMKMFLSKPDGKDGSKVYIDFEKAMVLIRQVDNLTLQVPKIIYLVGWQYKGHDDKYPAFFGVNPALKRPQDSSARESLLWLMKEAKKYNTIISLHINMTDAYDDSPSWNEYKANDLISKNADGSLMVTGEYNNRKSFQINYRNEWKKGFAQKRINRLLELLPPLKEAGTIHIDAWIAKESKGHLESVDTERYYQKKIADYWIQKGIEPTSEWTMDYMRGLIPYYWHFNGHTQADYLKYPASVITGGHMNPDLKGSDFGLEFLFGTSMYGENRFPNIDKGITDDNWDQSFTKDFYLNFLQYYYLNRLDRINVTGEKNNRIALFSGGVRTSLADSTVYENDNRLRKDNTIYYPVLWKKGNNWVAYSPDKSDVLFTLPTDWKGVKIAEIFLITKSGLIRKGKKRITGKQIVIKLTPGVPVLIVPKNNHLNNVSSD